MANFDKEQDEWGTTFKFRLLPALATESTKGKTKAGVHSDLSI